ncbi:aspartate/glutamate racemase family protein [Candidatus Bipolaricaulota sp. J31]
MRILVIEPVVNGRWAEEDRAYFQELVGPGTEVELVPITRGPRSIETFYDVAYAAPEILRVVRERAGEVDALVINCFADPAVDAARELTDRVVVGPAEASMSLALHLGRKFAVVSVLPNTASWVEVQALKFGVERRLAAAVGIEIPVLELESFPKRTVDAIVSAARETVERDGAEVIVLGCTGMAALASAVRERLPVPVIEPAGAAVKLAELLVALGLRHHRGRTYLPPVPEKIVGY